MLLVTVPPGIAARGDVDIARSDDLRCAAVGVDGVIAAGAWNPHRAV